MKTQSTTSPYDQIKTKRTFESNESTFYASQYLIHTHCLVPTAINTWSHQIMTLKNRLLVLMNFNHRVLIKKCIADFEQVLFVSVQHTTQRRYNI